jgi:fatty-acyl-CoA synthase
MAGIGRTDLVWRALEAAAEAFPEQRGFVYQGREISFREMDDFSNRVASAFLAMGIRRGDRIGIIALTQPEWLYTYFAASKIGAVIVGLNVRYRESELDYMLNQSEARAVVTLSQFADMDYASFFREFRPRIASVRDFIFIKGQGFPGSRPMEALLRCSVDRGALEQAKTQVQPEDLMIIIYSSGTTGRPKGAAITHRSQLASAMAQADHTRMTADDLVLVPLPLNHVGGITCRILVNLLARSTSVLIPTFTADEVIQQAIRYLPTVMGGVPTMHLLLMMHRDFIQWDRSRVRLVSTGGANADPELLQKLRECFPNAALMNLYGLSESSGAVVMSPWESDFDTIVRSIGKPIGEFRAKIVDPEGRDLPVGEPGELCIQGDAVAKGYFRMPHETEEAFDRDGWLHTGDVADMDERGYITLMGRRREMYIQGGFNVYPAEVENLLTKHPKVLMAAGIGVPDPVLGEIGRYYIVPRPGQEPTEEEIREYCRERLADYKIPRQVVFRQELPLTPVGKVMKARLREEYERTGQ